MVKRDLGSNFLFKAKENNKEAQSKWDALLREIIRACHLSRCRGCQQRIKRYNLNPEMRKVCIEHCVKHKSWSCSFNSKYPKYEFKRSTVSNCRKRITKDPKSRKGPFTKAGRPNKVSDKVILKIKEMTIGTHFSGTVISWRMVISIGTGVLKRKQTALIHYQNLGKMLYWLIFGQEAFWNPWIVLNVNETMKQG